MNTQSTNTYLALNRQFELAMLSPGNQSLGARALQIQHLHSLTRGKLPNFKPSELLIPAEPGTDQEAFGFANGPFLLATHAHGVVRQLFLVDQPRPQNQKPVDSYLQMLAIAEVLNPLGKDFGLWLYREGQKGFDLRNEKSVLFYLLRRSFPRNESELRIVRDPEWQEGAMWGFPRRGHPEGKVIFHVEEVLGNVERIAHLLSAEDHYRMRLIALIHDTFKNKVDQDRPKSGANDHAVIARNFAHKHTQDRAVLDVIEHHDAAYRIFRKSRRWTPEKVQFRLTNLFKGMTASPQFYYLFFLCDTHTGNKGLQSIHWFEREVAGRIQKIQWPS